MRFHRKASDLPPTVLGGPIAATMPNGRAPFWRLIAGEWWKPKGPQGGQPSEDKGPSTMAEPTQGYKPFGDYEAFMPMRRLLGGLGVAFIDKVDVMPVTTYPLLMPRVERSGLQVLAARRTAFQMDMGVSPTGQRMAYPRLLNANTTIDMRWRVGVPVPMGAGGMRGQTPGGVVQAGYAFSRRALRVPRYSTIPVTTNPTQH